MRSSALHGWLLSGLAALLPMLSAPAAAWAQAASSEPAPQPTPAEAKAEAAKLKQQGDEAMGSLRYAEALEKYEQAYALEPNPALSYNRGRALQALDRFPEALEQFEAFVAKAPPALRARVSKLDELVGEVRAKVTTLTLTCSVDGAKLVVSGRVVGTTPLAGPLKVNAGPAVVEAFADGYEPKRVEAVLPGGKDYSVQLDLVARSKVAVLVVRSPVAGATVTLDDRPVGTVPAEARLPAGEHRVVVSHDGYDEATTQVVLAAGATKTIDVALDELPSVAEAWWLWTGIGAVVVAGVVITAVALTERSPDSGDMAPGTVTSPLLRGPALLRF